MPCGGGERNGQVVGSTKNLDKTYPGAKRKVMRKHSTMTWQKPEKGGKGDGSHPSNKTPGARKIWGG